MSAAFLILSFNVSAINSLTILRLPKITVYTAIKRLIFPSQDGSVLLVSQVVILDGIGADLVLNSFCLQMRLRLMQIRLLTL